MCFLLVFLLYLALEVQHEEIPRMLLVPIFTCFPPALVPLSCQSVGKERALNIYKLDLKKILGRKSSDLQRLRNLLLLLLGPGSQLLPRGEGLLLELEISLALRLLGSCSVCLAKAPAPASAEAQHMEAFCA